MSRTWILGGLFVVASIAALAIAFAMGGHPPAPVVEASDFDEIARRAEATVGRVDELEARMRDLERAIGERAAATCDAAALQRAGAERADPAAAFALFDESYQCDPQPAVATSAALAACASKQAAAAQRYYALVPAASQPRVRQACARNNVELASAAGL